ncbi:MAG TPA: hypothetical protein VF624_12245 [Tepidisphaeraceae bacterium]
MRPFFSLAATAAVLVVASVDAFAAGQGAEAFGYVPGTGPENYRNFSTAPVGLPTRDSGYGAVTPFNPPFATSDVLIVGGGGTVTIRLDNAVGVDDTSRLGVFGNNGIIDEDPETAFDENFNYVAGGRGIVGRPPKLFSPIGSAQVSVSTDGDTFLAVGGVRAFDNPTNGFTDNDVNLGTAAPGARPTDPFKPFMKTLADFAGLRYRDPAAKTDILRLLDGSAGGNWIDLSGVPLASISYVKFDVPAGSRLAIDAVTAVPEPASLGLIGFAAMLLRRGRARR